MYKLPVRVSNWLAYLIIHIQDLSTGIIFFELEKKKENESILKPC